MPHASCLMPLQRKRGKEENFLPYNFGDSHGLESQALK